MNNFFVKHKRLDNIQIFKYSKKKDKRGHTFTIFLDKYFKTHKFVHDKITYANKNSLRGMHSDDKTSKLITCLFGKVFCNLVNDNKNSKFYKKKYSFYLSQDLSIFMPPKILLGWCVITNGAILSYKFSYNGKYNDFNNQKTVKYNDPNLNLSWPINKKNMIISNRDKY